MTQNAQPTDIMELIDKLAAQVTDGRRVLLTNRIMVEEVEFFSLLDELRQAIPNEVYQARRVLQERQKVILDAQEEAQKILATAKDRAEYLISEKGLTAEARYRGEDYLRQARDNAKRSMGEVDGYAHRVLDEVERVMRENLADIARAKGTLSEQH
jgi:vacuolar-type H+-ATPase subunit H